MQNSEPVPVLDEIPSTVRYVKNGRRRGGWWPRAKANNQIHVGWRYLPTDLIENPGDFSAIRRLHEEYESREGIKDPGARRRDLNQLLSLLDHPSRHVWITFEEGCLWWCTVADQATANPRGEDQRKGRFWLTCSRPWSNRSLIGQLLARADLPGVVDRVAGFRATVCKPQNEDAILRVIRGEQDADSLKAARAREAYEQAVRAAISKLTPQDFEQLIDLILARTAWTRMSTLGKSQEGIDLEATNVAADEIAFVQVKSAASQATLDDYVRRFQARRDRYQRMIFAVHTPDQVHLVAPPDLPVQVWTGKRLAKLVVLLGLGEWVEHKLA